MDTAKPSIFQLAAFKHSWIWFELSFKGLILDSAESGSSLEQLALNHSAFLGQLEETIMLFSELITYFLFSFMFPCKATSQAASCRS